MAYFCNGKKGVCTDDTGECGQCEFFDGKGGVEIDSEMKLPDDYEYKPMLTPDVVYIFSELNNCIYENGDSCGMLAEALLSKIKELKEIFGYEV